MTPDPNESPLAARVRELEHQIAWLTGWVEELIDRSGGDE